MLKGGFSQPQIALLTNLSFGTLAKSSVGGYRASTASITDIT